MTMQKLELGTLKSLVKLKLGTFKVKQILSESFNLIDCYSYKQSDFAILLIRVNYEKNFMHKTILNKNKIIEKYIGKYKYNLIEDPSRLSIHKTISNFKENLKTRRTNVPMFMEKLASFIMSKENIKGVLIVIRGVIFGARKSKKKVSKGKQKYTGSYLKDYVQVTKDILEIPKGCSGLTVKIFYQTPAKYDLKSYLEKKIKESQ